MNKKNIYLCNLKTITLDIPEALEIDKNDLAMMLSAMLYRQGRLSIGQAAKVAGVTKRTFSELLGKYETSIFNYPETDLKEDVANA